MIDKSGRMAKSFLAALVLVMTSLTGAAADDKKAIVLATADFEPYYASTLPDGGIVTEIAREAFDKAGYTMKVEFLPWARAMVSGEKGDFAGVLGAWYTDERTKTFIYSKPIFKNEIVFFERKGANITYNSFRDLAKYKIGVSNQAAPYDILKGDLLASFEVGNVMENSIAKLAENRIDLFADEKLSILHLINTKLVQYKDKIEVMTPPIQVNNLHVIISRKIPDCERIAADFDRGLELVVQSGGVERLMTKHGFVE